MKKVSIISAFINYSISVIIIILSASTASGDIISEARLFGMPQKFYDAYVKPLRGKKKITSLFKESTHKGSYYDIGRSKAEFILSVNPNYKKSVTRLMDSIFDKSDPVRFLNVKNITHQTKKFFPEILEEIRGFAEVTGIDYSDAVRIYTLYGISRFGGGCTIFAIAGKNTKHGNLTIGRNYDWLPTMSDLHLMGIEPQGAYKSIGFSEFIIGNLDGMNEKGLFIGIAAVKSKSRSKTGFFFPLIVRAVLDKAQTVNEAVDIIKKVKHSDGTIFFAADRNGNAAVIEAVPDKKISVRFLKDEKDGLLIATNHYQNKGSSTQNDMVSPNSYERIHILRRLLKNKKVSKQDIMNALTNKRPDGVFMHYYDMGFGTLYSSVYDLSQTILSLKAGSFEKKYNISALNFNNTKEINYINNKSSLHDFVDLSGFNPVKLNSFFLNYSFMFITTPVIAPVIEADFSYKAGLFGTEKTYGPHLNIGIYTLITPAFSRAGLKLTLNPFHFFSFEIIPFYFTGWKVFSLPDSNNSNAGVINDNLINAKNEFHHSPAIIINPVFRFGSFLTIENRFYFYNFQKTVYDYRSFLLVKNSVIWTPSLQILIPYSPDFLWGVAGEANVNLSSGNFNVQLGPVIVFPRLFCGLTLVVAPTWWIHLSEGNDIFNLLIVLRGRI